MTCFARMRVLSMLILPAVPIAALAQSSGVIPPAFRGKIVYEGYLEGKKKTPGRPVRNLTLGNLLESAMSAKTEDVRASVRYEVEYDGQNLRGTHSAQGELHGTGSFTGTRNGTGCDIVFQDGLRASFFCDANHFASDQKFTDSRGRSFNNHIEAHTTSVVDYAERDRRAAAAQQQARQEAAAAAARYAALPNAGAALTQRLDGYVQKDSQGWAFNHYNPGTMRNVKIVDGSVRSGSFVMRGDYVFNGGSQGWVMAKMVGGKLQCIQFWDAQIGCRGLRTPEQGQAMRGLAIGAVAGAMSDGPSGSSSESAGRQAEEDLQQSRATQEQMDNMRPPPN